MSTLEMKGEIFELISTVRTEAGIENLLQLLREFVVKETANLEDESDMTPLQIAALRRAIERSHDDRNFLSNNEAQTQLSKWLNN